MKHLGYTEVDCVIVDLDEQKEKALNVALNKISGEWDTELLTDLLKELDKNGIVSLTGFDTEELDDLFAGTEYNVSEDNFNVEEAVEEIDNKPFTKQGDIWHIKNHKLLCGDSTKLEEVERLFKENEQADLIVTDPPYNIDYGTSEQDRARARGKKIENRSILNDNMDDESFYKFLLSFYETAFAVTKGGGAIYVFHSTKESVNFIEAMKNAGYKVSQTLVWVKDHFTLGRSDYQWQHEPILYGWKVEDGKPNSFYPVIYGLEDGADWNDEKNWYKANPSLDITVDVDKLRQAFNSAKENPAEENLFRQLRLNQWVKQSVRWMPMDKWNLCSFNVDRERLKGRICYGGLDLSSTTDITAFVLVFPPEDEDGKYEILPFFWLPEETLDLRVRRDHVPYDVWEKKGLIMTTEGNVVHYGFIEKFIENLGTLYDIKEIAYDRWGAVQMVQNLEGMGFTIVPFGQGYKDMSPATKELMKLVLEKKIAHSGNEVLAWMMDNVYVKTDPAGNVKPDKEKSTEKIDGAVALIMALDRALRHNGDAESIYNERGILIL